ncbi:MAG: hypothetical protein KIT84_12850 [Labilithrix sp.]|nr:hypothetical protein [Labilithrix sp.]MCW5811903.1 hypothetical protein [Labilithrix sp.]
MIKAALAIGALVLAVAGPREAEPACIPAEKCCSICDAGQACGNSCISRKKTCHKGRGCACNAAEVCGR